mmetsp:Transcript_22409/g.52847  ORF Transcript_22409/g.52847 Transcript_22409/m.52847 type:complete len:251 (-) Transcript_22409:1147-1899(-)
MASRTTLTSPSMRMTSSLRSSTPWPSFMLSSMNPSAGPPSASSIRSSLSLAPSTTPRSTFEMTSTHGLRGKRDLSSRLKISWSSTLEHLSPAPPDRSMTYITAVGRWDMAARVSSSISFLAFVPSRRFSTPGESMIWQSCDTANVRPDGPGLLLDVLIFLSSYSSPSSLIMPFVSSGGTASSPPPPTAVPPRASVSLILRVLTPRCASFSWLIFRWLGMLTPATFPDETSPSDSQKTSTCPSVMPRVVKG